MYLHEKLNLSEEQVENVAKTTMEFYNSTSDLGDAMLDLHQKLTGKEADDEAKMLMFAYFALGSNHTRMSNSSKE